jgi:hydrogenase/urease accessory protein HupE
MKQSALAGGDGRGSHRGRDGGWRPRSAGLNAGVIHELTGGSDITLAALTGLLVTSNPASSRLLRCPPSFLSAMADSQIRVLSLNCWYVRSLEDSGVS